jgi:hypothetical protein
MNVQITSTVITYQDHSQHFVSFLRVSVRISVIVIVSDAKKRDYNKETRLTMKIVNRVHFSLNTT